uniref:Chd7_2 protein n=1 Tax=Fopius arisanus TaxID=64838 RepID=A0A0C9QNG6_9HYME
MHASSEYSKRPSSPPPQQQQQQPPQQQQQPPQQQTPPQSHQPPQPQPQIRPTMGINDRSMMEQQPPTSESIFPVNGNDNIHSVVETTTHDDNPPSITQSQSPDTVEPVKQSSTELLSQDPVLSNSQLNLPIEQTQTMKPSIEPVQSLPASSTSGNVECSTPSPLMQSQVEVAPAVSTDNEVSDIKVNEQSPEINTSQHSMSSSMQFHDNQGHMSQQVAPVSQSQINQSQTLSQSQDQSQIQGQQPPVQMPQTPPMSQPQAQIPQQPQQISQPPVSQSPQQSVQQAVPPMGQAQPQPQMTSQSQPQTQSPLMPAQPQQPHLNQVNMIPTSNSIMPQIPPISTQITQPNSVVPPHIPSQQISGGPLPPHQTAVSIPNNQPPPPHTMQPCGFGEYTNMQKPNMYQSDMIVGSGQQYHPGGEIIPGAIPNMYGMSTTPGGTFNNAHAPVTHHQERAALQQQLQELFCMPPAQENQEKIVALQEKLQALQQHETNDQCSGGPGCILATPMFQSTVVDSPQVSSTTGRGRSKGAPRTKKNRKKADKEAAAPITSQPVPAPEQPVSENLVTPGDSSIADSVADSEDNKPSSGDHEEEWNKTRKSRVPRKPRKPKEPKEPKEIKIKKEKVPKESKSPKGRKKKDKEGRESSKRGRKKIIVSDSADEEVGDEHEDVSESSAVQDADVKSSEPPIQDDQELVDSSTTEPIQTEGKEEGDDKGDNEEAVEEDEKKEEVREAAAVETATPAKKKSSRKRSVGGKGTSTRTPRASKKRKSRIAPDSDGEELATTPPPSPEADDTNKRRSSRNTHRKKYVDDVMLRFSDEEMPAPDAKKSDGSTAKPTSTKRENEGGDVGPNKPNFVYINTTDEDSMVVQHILCMRMGKREIKPTPVAEVKPEEGDKEKTEEDKKEEQTENAEAEKKSEEPDKEEHADEKPEEEKEAKAETDQIENKKDEEENKPQETGELEVKDEKPKEEEKTEETEPQEPESTATEPSEATEVKPQIVEVEEYLVKYRNFSYLHCEWRTEEELYKGDKRIQAKLKRFKQKLQQSTNIFENTEDDPFNPDFVEVDRVLDEATHTDPTTGETVRHYLVKWRSLQYEDSTWELEEDVDSEKIAQFRKFNKVPSKDQWKPKKKPTASQWQKLDESPVYKSGNSLRPYQLEGLNWLLFSWYNGHNCILADEMGLGKTIQSLTFVDAVYKYGIRGPFLIIAPLSTIPNWQREFEGWTEMNVVVYHGSAASRTMLQEYEVYYKNDKGNQIKDLIKFNVLITTFEIIITDFNELKGYNWRLCVIDEAHRLKNRNCKLLEGLRQLNLEHRVLLSGTPLQNNVNELFSLLNFLEPNQFASNEAFLKEFGNLSSEGEVNKLQLLLKPMMLRRLKEDVEKSLAPKEETVVEVELTNIQKKYYRGILERNFSFLAKGTTSANIPNLMNTMMELRKCCIHPFLLNGAEDQIQLDYKTGEKEDSDAYYHALVNSSGKMVLVDKLLPKLKAGGHRVLVFSQMVKCLDLLEDYLVYKKYPYERIDGRIRGNLRQAAIDRYSKPDSDRFVFLLCTKAGGLGINLTAADTVIIYDSDWNPQNDLQAQARCHRIGQQKMVKVYRLLCRNTYEREMFDKASMKLGLDKAILQSMNTAQGSGGKDPGNKQLTKKEIEDLLKKGAYGAIMDDDTAGDKFCEEDIDQILERRTQVITIEAEKGSTFSKASFACASNRSDINIDDPDFWNKWAKKAEIDTTEKKEEEDLVISEPRRRTQIKRYGHDESVVDMSELDSSDDSDDDGGLTGRGKKRRDKFGKKKKYCDEYVPREGEVVYGSWARSECFKVERGLLTFGWGRWEEILQHSQLRRGWREIDIEDCARVILLYCLRYYRGDEKIRSFIWDLITPLENGEKIKTITINQANRNSRNKKKNSRVREGARETRGSAINGGPSDPNHWSHAEKYDGDIFLESTYRKHLSRHATKVLLRVRMLYYIKHEIIGDLVQHISDGVHVREDSIEQDIEDGEASTAQKDGKDSEKFGRETPANSPAISSKADTPVPEAGGSHDGAEVLLDDDKTWPSVVDLNTRLRRVISSYQRSVGKKEDINKGLKGAKPPMEMEMTNQAGTNTGEPPLNMQGWDLQQLAMYLLKMERREKMEQMVKERERTRIEEQKAKWSRREESEFLRVVSTYGVNYDRKKAQYDWTKFKSLARFDKKSDADLTDYYMSFRAMCKKACNSKGAEEEGVFHIPIDQLSPGRARQILDRVDLLSKIREEILSHPHLEERLSLCQPSGDTPDWWVPGRHDKELLLGAAKHGLGRTDITILNDPDFSFHKILGKSIFGGIPPAKAAVPFDKSDKAIKIENRDDILKFDKDEILVKLEKGEGTLKIEKVGFKRDSSLPPPDKKLDVPEKGRVELTIVKTEGKSDEKTPKSWLTITALSSKSPELDKTSEVSADADKPSEETPEGEKTQEKPVVETEADEKEPESKITEVEAETPAENTEKLEEKIAATEKEQLETPEKDKDEEIEEKSKDKDAELHHEEEKAPKTDEESSKETSQPSEELKPPEETSPDINPCKEDDKIPKEVEKSEVSPEGMEVESSEVTVEPSKSQEAAEKSPEAAKSSEDSTMDVQESDDASKAPEKPKDTQSEATDSALLDTKPVSLVEEKSTEVDEKTLEPSSEKPEKTPEVAAAPEDKPEKSPSVKEQVQEIPEEKTEKEASKTSKIEDKGSIQAAELKAMFPDLEVIQPLSRLTQIDTFVLRDKSDYPEPPIPPLLPHNFPSSVKWPKEHAVEARLMHIVHAIEHKEWPVAMNFTAGDEVEILSADKDNSEVITITTDHGVSRALAATTNNLSSKKRKRHIAIDVETERAKLHALLNSSHMTSQPPQALSKPSVLSGSWDLTEESQSEDSRRSTPQPPPAHQQTRNSAFDLKYTVPGKTTIIPGTSSTLTPIDLSAGYMKTSSNEVSKDIMNEVQDFSMPSKNKQPSSNKGKLDSMLDKLMKRKNVPVDEPVIGKEKKRRKLDEIVLGLSAAKEQQGTHFPEHNKKSTITPNVTVTPTSAPIGLPTPPAPAQKPFSITVTSIPSSRASSSSHQPPPSLHSHKDSFSALLAQAEQQNRDLKKQQQLHAAHSSQSNQQLQQQLQQQQAFNSGHMSSSSHRKSYEAMIADINKVAEYSSKIGSYSHEAKVNKWLAEQTAMSDQLSAEYLNAPRRRRPRVDPSLLDWKKLTGEENVAVINRITGKKVTGSKAPQLKRLGQWLMENPMFDVDPKWAELVKERGNLPHDLQKRLPGQERSSNKGKTPGRPPMMPSPTSQQQTSQNLAATSMASQLNFPGLGNLNNSLLSGLSLGNFDPKNNPLLMPFGGLPNLGALGGLGNLGNLSNMSLTNSLFANLAGLGLPSLAGMEALSASAAATSSAETNVVNSSSKTTTTSTSSSSKSRSKQMDPPTSKSSAPSTSSSSLPTTTPFPFFFPNPSLLYTPLGLGGLNPFSMQPGGVSSAYESLAQCGLLNPPTSTASSSRKSTSSTSSSSRRESTADMLKRKESEKKSASAASRYQMESSLALQAYTDAIHAEERRRSEVEKKEALEISEIADLSARMERKSKEQEMKEALEQLSRTSAELFTRTIEETQRPQKRSRTSEPVQETPLPASLEVTLEPVVKKSRVEAEHKTPSISSFSDIAEESPTKTTKSHTPSSTPASTPQPTPASTPTPTPTPTTTPAPRLATPQPQEEVTSNTSLNTSLNTSSNSNKESVDSHSEDPKESPSSNSKSESTKSSFEHEEETKGKSTGKKSRGAKRVTVEPPVERKNLRSSAGRQARAAAERQARMEGELAQQAAEEAQNNE